MLGTETKTKEELETEVKAKEEESNKWDAERQRADQAESVATKAREEATAYAEAYEESQTKIAELQSKLNTLEKTQQDKRDELAQMDGDIVDKGVIANIQRMEARHKKLSDDLEQLNLKAKAYEEAEQKRTLKANKEAAKEEILSSCDEEFGSKYRNEAYKVADEWVDSGKEIQPTTQFAAYKLMRKAYQEAKSKAEAKEKKTVPTDSGSGGISHKTSTRKTGSMKDVLADMKKDKSWLSET